MFNNIVIINLIANKNTATEMFESVLVSKITQKYVQWSHNHLEANLYWPGGHFDRYFHLSV